MTKVAAVVQVQPAPWASSKLYSFLLLLGATRGTLWWWGAGVSLAYASQYAARFLRFPRWELT